jgi:hypothetical protein
MELIEKAGGISSFVNTLQKHCGEDGCCIFIINEADINKTAPLKVFSNQQPRDCVA